MKEHTYDIIIPVYHPGRDFDRVLELLRGQEPAPQKIILMETLEAGEEPESRDGCEVHAVRKQDFDHAGTRRLGVSWSYADAFLMMTQDAVPRDGMLAEQLLRALYPEEETETEQKREPEAAARRRSGPPVPLDGNGEIPCADYVRLLREHETDWAGAEAARRGRAMAYARQLPAEDCSEAERFTRSFSYPAESCVKTAADLPRLGIRTFFASDVCCMYDRNTYETLNGFVPSAVFNEDMLYAAAAVKAGYSVAYAAEAACIHSHNYTAAQQFHRYFDNGMSQAMHPEVFQGIRSEGEGIRLVKATAGHLLRKGKPWLLPGLFLQSAAKYLGFRLGKAWERLPEQAVRRFALNKTFADRICREKNSVK